MSLITTHVVRALSAALVLACSATATAPAQKPQLVVQIGHTETIVAVAFARGGEVLASGSSDGTVKLWDVKTRSVRVGHRR